MRKMKIIDLLNKIANSEQVPNKIMYNEVVWEYEKHLYDYRSRHNAELLFSDEVVPNWVTTHLKTEVEIIDDEEDKDIPLIPDDELYVFKGDSRELNYNFRVLKEKINQVVEEFNEYRKGNE